MKKVITGIVCAVLLAAGGLAYNRINRADANNVSNTAYADETGFFTEYAETVYLNYSDFTVTAFHDTEENGFLSESKLVSELLKNVEWIDGADVTVFKPESFDGSDYSDAALAAVLEMSKQPENEEIDGIVQMIMLTLEGIKRENISVTDKTGNVLESRNFADTALADETGFYAEFTEAKGDFDEMREDNNFIKINVEKLIEWNEPNGEGCIVSDKITKEGFKVGYMYREEPSDGVPDSGWRFMAGNEDDEYMDDPNNHHIFAVNTVCNYDSDIIPYVYSDIGSAYIRTDGNNFELDNGSKPIFIDKQKNE